MWRWIVSKAKSQTKKIAIARLEEIQSDVLALASAARALHAQALQLAGDIPGARQLDIPGTKPRAKPLAQRPEDDEVILL